MRNPKVYRSIKSFYADSNHTDGDNIYINGKKFIYSESLGFIQEGVDVSDISTAKAITTESPSKESISIDTIWSVSNPSGIGYSDKIANYATTNTIDDVGERLDDLENRIENCAKRKITIKGNNIIIKKNRRG